MLKVEDIIEAKEVTYKTLIGVSDERPLLKRGNCFSVKCGEDNLRVVNFYYENLDWLIKIGVVSFPISVIKLSKSICVIVDERIDKEWYRGEFCESCTPIELLPIPQRVKHLLDIKLGVRKEEHTDKGIIISRTI